MIRYANHRKSTEKYRNDFWLSRIWIIEKSKFFWSKAAIYLRATNIPAQRLIFFTTTTNDIESFFTKLSENGILDDVIVIMYTKIQWDDNKVTTPFPPYWKSLGTHSTNNLAHIRLEREWSIAWVYCGQLSGKLLVLLFLSFSGKQCSKISASLTSSLRILSIMGS